MIRAEFIPPDLSHGHGAFLVFVVCAFVIAFAWKLRRRPRDGGVGE